MLPELHTSIPGPRSKALAKRLREYETQNVTYVSDQWPIFWERAEGVNIWDADGNRFLDMTSAFGVSGLGHGNLTIVRSMQDQSSKLMHAMGDVHPTELKVELCEQLSSMTFEKWGKGKGKTTLANSGFEAVEIAIKTGIVATGKKGVVCFQNGYHGLGYGALLGSSYEKFRKPFSNQLLELREVLDFPSNDGELSQLHDTLKKIDPSSIGVLLVEPIQGRGGKVVPPVGFLKLLREWCDQHDVVLAFDEIYTGFNRTGKLFACDWEGVVPDLLCVGKALSSGFPISACVGKSEIMNRWPESAGEALHTSTFLGNPVGCSMSLTALKEHKKEEWRERVLDTGDYLMKQLKRLKKTVIQEVRGRGLMVGVELSRPAGEILEAMLRKGVVMLADGPEGNVLAFTPPFMIEKQDIDFVISSLAEELI